jgi:predicted DNA-binding transcriptional regulator AlpA
MSLTILENYVSRREFAEQLGKDERTVIRWEIQRRAPKRTKIGRSVYFSRKSIQDWLKAQEESAA